MVPKRTTKRPGISQFFSEDEALGLELSMRARSAWGEWLGEAYLWHHFATFTFVWGPGPERAVQELRRWIRKVERLAQGPVGCFYVAERGEATGQLHLHVLLVGTQRLSSHMLERSWRHGRSEVSVYDSHLAGSYYVTKDVGLQTADWGFVNDSHLVSLDLELVP